MKTSNHSKAQQSYPVIPNEAAELASPISSSILNNQQPVPDALNQLAGTPYFSLLKNLQGNILKGHGRDYSANIFIKFSDGIDLEKLLGDLSSRYVTSAFKQIEESEQYKKFKIPGAMFGNLFLTKKAYEKLGFGEEELKVMFKDEVENSNVPAFPQNSSFLQGMFAAAEDLGDLVPNQDQADTSTLTPLQRHVLSTQGKAQVRDELEPLEVAYVAGNIDAMLLLADDDEGFLLRQTRSLITELEFNNLASVLAVELGKALRNQDKEGIEHFGYVDGRSQPLYLASDFKNLDAQGNIVFGQTTERINEKAVRKESGAIDIWNPFEPLSRVLVEDKGTSADDAFGSYFVFRKLEQDVLRFSMAEQLLADKLELTGSDRERAGAMAVGRFRDGTPLVLSQTDGLIPAKANNFRYDGLNAQLENGDTNPNDRLGLRCPFQAHIRKTNPRQSLDRIDDSAETRQTQENTDRLRRITRRGIPYGVREKAPNEFQALDDLPTKNVGLLFACFQSSIVKQFAFMQKTWANNIGFRVPFISQNNPSATGIDPIIGQTINGEAGNPEHNWRQEYDGVVNQNPVVVGDLDLTQSHSKKFSFSNFVKFRGGEFFFAPSIPFLLHGKSGPQE